MRCLPLLLLVAGLTATGCGKDEKPVSVPMDEVPVSPEDPGRNKTTADTDPEPADAGPTPRYTGRGPGATATKAPGEAPIDSCCGALLDKANSAKDEPTKRLYDQAAAICYRRAKAVREGKMTRAEALAQVRSSLLGPAPAACN